MRSVHGALAWLRSLFLRGRLEREMRDEMAQHIERATSRLMARGLTQAEAERQAHREFGNLDYLREAARDARGNRWVETIAQDLRYAVRHFGRTPLSTASMMLILSLGIGSSTVLYALMRSMLTQPSPGVERQDGMVRIRGLGGPLDTRGLTLPEVRTLAAQQSAFAQVAAYSPSSVLVQREGEATVPAQAFYADPQYFTILGLRPVAGSFPAASNEDALVAVISERMWREDYSASVDVIGRSVRVNDVPVTIIGVAPPRFYGISGSTPRRVLWLPVQAHDIVGGSKDPFVSSGDTLQYNAVATLAPGATMRRANAAARSVARQFAPASDERARASADVVPLLNDNERPYNDSAFLAVGAVFGALCLLIMLITCANVSTLLTGMAATRGREIAVRLTMGASRRRVIRQLLVESATLALGAGALALAIGVAGVVAAQRYFGDEMNAVLDWTMLVWTAAAALLTALLFGLAPALHATRLSVAHVLKDAGAAVSGSRSLLQRALVVTQVAVTQPLLVALAALLVGGAVELRSSASSPLHERIAVLNFNTWAGNADPEQRNSEVAAVLERVRQIPGVAGAVSTVNGSWSRSFSFARYTVQVHPGDRVGGAGEELMDLRGEYAAPGYFAMHDIPLVAGREFTAEDDDAVIIGDDLARALFGTSSPLGRRLIRQSRESVDSSGLVIVGVVDHTRAGAGEVSGRVRAFIHHTGVPMASVLVRTQAAALPMLDALRRASADAAPALPLGGIMTVAQIEAGMRQRFMQIGLMAAAGGLVALGLAALGLYAVIAQGVKQRRREIGIRTALGADRRGVSGLFFRGGLRLSAVGLVLGLPLSILTLHVLTQQTGLPRTNLGMVTALVGGAVLTVAAMASWLPARAAASIDPLQALRSD